MKTNIRLVFNRYNRLRNGKAYVYIEVAFSRTKIRYINTKIEIEPNQWNEKKKEVNSKLTSYINTNRYLRKKISEILDYEMDLLNIGKSLTPELLDAFLQGKSANSKEFYKFVMSELVNENVKIETFNRSRVLIKKLDRHTPNLTFTDVNYAYIKNVDTWLRNSPQISSINTVANYHKIIKKYIRLAVNLGYIKYEQNPYNTFKVKKEPATRKNITEQELELFANCYVNNSSSVKIIQDMFVFACYTGLRYSDIVNIQKKHIIINGNEVTISIDKMVKTQKPVELPLNMLFKGKPLVIFKKYYNKDAKFLFGKPFTNQFINRELKYIADKSGIKYKNITFHMARHTFGSLLAEKTGDPYLIKDLMGHSDIKMSMSYIHSSKKGRNDKLKKVEW